jgi:hypothetical protein
VSDHGERIRLALLKADDEALAEAMRLIAEEEVRSLCGLILRRLQDVEADDSYAAIESALAERLAEGDEQAKAPPIRSEPEPEPRAGW